MPPGIRGKQRGLLIAVIEPWTTRIPRFRHDTGGASETDLLRQDRDRDRDRYSRGVRRVGASYHARVTLLGGEEQGVCLACSRFYRRRSIDARSY